MIACFSGYKFRHRSNARNLDRYVNVFMPTNATLLLTLGLTTVTYPKWFRWAGPILLTVFGMTIGILMLAQFVIFA